MDRNIKTRGLVNLLTWLVVGVGSFFLARLSHSFSAQAEVIFLGLGFLVAAVSYFQMRLMESERLEQMEFEELKKSSSASALFTTEADTFPARRAREQFERWFVPAFTVVLLLLQGAAAYGLWRWLSKATAVKLEQPLVAMSLYGLFALVLFLLGKYSSGLARLEKQYLLRPGASYLLLAAYLSFLVAACIAAVELGFRKVDLYAAWALAVLLAVMGLETLINLVLEIYRPRVKGQAPRVLYESRLTGLLGHPEGLITTAAQALDYQFGFKVSETWFYRFLERALAWIILLQLGVLLLSTTIVVIEPAEQGIWERFGRPLSGKAVLEPGLHIKWPWPIDRVYRYPTREIQTVHLGVVHDPELEKEKTVLWTKPHYKDEFNLLVASREQGLGRTTNNAAGQRAVPVNLLIASVPIQYQITNLLAWAYNHASANKLLEDIAGREVVRYLVNVDIDALMTWGRLPAAEELRRRIQARADHLQLGAQILSVGLQDVHPPVKVADAYEAVVGAMQQRETNILAARAHLAEKIPQALAEATNILAQAANDHVNRVTAAEAEAAQFSQQIAAYQASPSVYRQRSYLEALIQAVGPARKYIITTTNTQDVITIDLEDKLRPDLLGIQVEAPKAETKK